eukprot:15032361-Alexandrium_andersonii.AAC.1
MSASLVGSEMCIRDRRGAADLGVRPTGPSAQHVCRSKCSSRAASRVSTCLLYTSDAADDM